MYTAYTHSHPHTYALTQSTGAAEYTDCISAYGVRLPQRVSWWPKSARAVEYTDCISAEG